MVAYWPHPGRGANVLFADQAVHWADLEPGGRLENPRTGELIAWVEPEPGKAAEELAVGKVESEELEEAVREMARQMPLQQQPEPEEVQRRVDRALLEANREKLREATREYRRRHDGRSPDRATDLAPYVADDRLRELLPRLDEALPAPALEQARATARRSSEVSNLHNIGLGIQYYRKDHDGAYPPSLDDLDDYIDDPQIFESPTDPEARLVYTPPGPDPEHRDLVAYWVHPGEGANILFADQSVQWTDLEPGGRLVNPRSGQVIAAGEAGRARTGRELARSRYNLGQSYLRRGRYEEAEKQFKSALKHAEGYEDARRQLQKARALQRATRRKEAREEADKAARPREAMEAKRLGEAPERPDFLTDLQQVERQITQRERRGAGRQVAQQRAAAPVLAFRYLSYPYELSLGVSHVRPELKAEPLHFVEITRKNVRYRSTFRYRIKKAGVFQLRLHLPAELRGSLVVTGPKVDDYSYEPASEVLTVQLTEKTTDEVTLELESEALLEQDLPAPGESGPLSVAPVYALDAEQERGYIVVGTDESIRLKRPGAADALHDVDVQEVAPSLLQRAQNPKLAFRLIRSPWELDLEVSSISPKIRVRTFNYVRFGQDYLVGASTVEFNIQYAGVKEFRVRLPEGVTEPNIRGQNIKIQEKVEKPDPEAPEGDLWRVELQSEVKGDYRLIFEYTTELDPETTRREFAGPRVAAEMPEVEREIGYLAVTADPSLELSPMRDRLQNLSPVDEEEIPVKFRRLPQSVAEQIGRETVPILFAFRYLGHPYRLALSSVRHEEAEVVTAVVESCKLDTTLTEEGGRITTFLAEVRSRYQSFLEIALPPDAQLWHALVNGRRVRPLADRTAGTRVTKIPIAQAQGVEGPVRVELQWEEAPDAPLGRARAVALELPPLQGVRILRLGWVLQLPRGYRVVSSSGTLERLPGAGSFEESLRRLQPTAKPQGAGAAGVRQAEQAPEQQQLSNTMVMQGRTAGKRPARPASAFAARKPQLPERFYFQALIPNPREPARVRALCVDQPARQLLLAAGVLAAFAACAAFWRYSGLSLGTRAAVLVAALALLGGARVMAEQDYAEFLAAGILAVGAAVVIFGVGSAVRAFRERPEPEEA